MTDKHAMGALVAIALINGINQTDCNNGHDGHDGYWQSSNSIHRNNVTPDRSRISNSQTGTMHLELSVYNLLFES